MVHCIIGKVENLEDPKINTIKKRNIFQNGTAIGQCFVGNKTKAGLLNRSLGMNILHQMSNVVRAPWFQPSSTFYYPKVHY